MDFCYDLLNPPVEALEQKWLQMGGAKKSKDKLSSDENFKECASNTFQ